MKNMKYSRGFIEENPDFGFLQETDEDGCFTRTFRKLASYLTSSIRFTVVHSESLRRYVSLRSNRDQDTLERLRDFRGSNSIDPECITTLDTNNGVMISGIRVGALGETLGDIIQEWMMSHPVHTRYSHVDGGFYKKLLRLKILIDHVRFIYSDKYNVYQAAYINEGYSFRATLCFVMQSISIVSLMMEPSQVWMDGTKSVGDYILLVVTVMYMFFNIPANYMTSNMSQGIVMLNVFYGMGMYSRMMFVMMDIIINTILMTFLPIVSAKLLSGTALSTEIVFRSLSVMFITSLDDNAITKGESNRFLESQNMFIKNMVERVDCCIDSNSLNFIKVIPWLETFTLLVSVVLAYLLLFINY